MDFFQRQEEARRASGRLTLLFIGAALLMIVGLYGGLLALAWAGGIHFTSPFWWQPILLAVATAVTLLLMGGSAWRASHRLQKSGGSHVAHRLGARPLRPEVPAEATLQNVVEEVAIAAGLPAPWVYLLDNQPGINAMAAGCAPPDAVLIVTDGALHQLSRDALQGVVAHEFSHILYGDMRLNTRLLGLLRGLMGPPRLSATVLRTFVPSRENTSCLLRLGLLVFLFVNACFFYAAGVRSVLGLDLLWASKALMLGTLGLGTTVLLGGLGTLAGRLIQRAVARQREFLADAAAVQFTRHPAGLQEPFGHIDATTNGARVLGPSLAPTRHFFFADPQPPPFFKRLLSSHPPLMDRLEALALAPPHDASPGPSPLQTDNVPTNRIGNPSRAHLDYGHVLHESLAPLLIEAAHTSLGAEALVYGLLLEEDADVQRRQQTILEEQVSTNVCEELQRLHPTIDALPARTRLPLVEMLAPALRALSPSQKQAFRRNLRALATADRSLSIFEFSLAKMLDHWLEAVPSGRASSLKNLSLVVPACKVLLSALACAGHDNERDARHAFATSAHFLTDAHQRENSSAEEMLFDPSDLQSDVSPRRVDQALDQLMMLAPVARQQVLDASARCVMADGRATVEEAELLRVIATLLECPLPPFLPSGG